MEDPRDRWVYLLLFSGIAFVPLLIRIHVSLFIAPKFTFDVFATGMQGEAFAYYKFLALCFMSLSAVGLLLAKMFFRGFRLDPCYTHIPMLVLAFWLLLSLAFADFRSIGLYGFFDRKEGVLTYLGFLTLALVFAQFHFPKKSLVFISVGLAIPMVANFVLAFSAYLLQFDLGKTTGLQGWIKPGDFQGTAEFSLTSLFENVNYSSGVSAAACVFFLTVGLLTPERKRKIFPALMASVSFFNIVAASSMSGFVTLAGVLPIVGIVAFLKFPQRSVAAGLLLHLVCFATIFAGSVVVNPEGYDEIAGFFRKFQSPQEPEKSPSITAMPLPTDRQVPSSAVSTTTPAVPSTMPVVSPTTTSLPPIGEDRLRRIKDAQREKEELAVAMTRPDAVGIDPVRAYIWSHSLALIRQRPLFGYGLDSLTFYIPQNNQARVAAFETTFAATKNHNFYLSMAFGAGIPALLALLVLFALHIFQTVRSILRSVPSESAILRLALFGYFLAYLVQWLVNDSTIGSSIGFWILLGPAVALNRKERPQDVGPPRENIVFLATLAALIIALPFFAWQAERENQDHLNFIERTEQAKALARNGKHKEALPILQELERRQADDFRILWQLGISLFQTGDYARSENYFRKARKANELIVLEPGFLLQFAEIEHNLGRYEIADVYLNAFKGISGDPVLMKEAEELQARNKARMLTKSTN